MCAVRPSYMMTTTTTMTTTTMMMMMMMNCIVPTGISPMEIRVAFPGKSQLRQSRATQPTMHAVFLLLIFPHNPPNSDMDYRIFNARTDVNACDCTQGMYGHHKESLHWKLTLGEKSFAAPGNRTCVSGVLVRISTNWTTSPPLLCHVQPFPFFVIDFSNSQKIACHNDKRQLCVQTVVLHLENVSQHINSESIL